MSPSAPILFFDSGIGGLSVLAPARALLANEPVVYAADSAGYPYGTKSEAELAARVPALLGRLVERYRPRLAVIACNTASTIALDHVRAALDIPVVGTVPAIKPAAEMSKTRVIGVLGTEATVRQPYVDNLAAEFASDCTIIRHGAQPMFDVKLGNEIDVGVLACTHFPLLRDELTQAFPGVEWIDGGPGIARRIAWLTREQPWPTERSDGVMVFTAEPRSPLLGALSLYGIGEVRTL